MPYLQAKPYLTLINIRHLNRINQMEGQEYGDQLLQRVGAALQALVAEDHAHFAFVRGLQGDFYLVSIDLSGEVVQRRLDHWLSERVPDIEVAITTVNLKHLRYYERTNLRYLIQYLHQFRDQDRMLLDTQEAVSAINEWIVEQLEMSVNLKKLIEPGNLRIHVQPIFRVVGRGFVAFEVLGRLQHGEQTLSAGLFIERLIELGLVDRFDGLMLEAICEQAQALRALTDTLFINASSASLRKPSYQEKLQQAIEGPLKDFNVVIELTEQVMLEEAALVRHLGERIGVQFAVDDFGTGFSSLHSVVELAETGSLRFLKIDGSLTQQIEQSAAIRRLFKVIQGLAEDLGVKTIAEFVETEEALHLLEEAGIDLIQGYYLGKPLPVDAWLVQRLIQGD